MRKQFMTVALCVGLTGAFLVPLAAQSGDGSGMQLRKQVAESLGKVKNMSLIPILEKVRAEDADIQVRVQADRAIENIKSY